MTQNGDGYFRVLAVDDSQLIHKAIASTLQGTEFLVVATARTGREAVSAYEDQRPDVVLLDIVMPEQSGKEALKQILDLDPGARVIMVSSLGTDDAVTECLQVGALRFVHKPFQQAELLRVLRTVVKY